MPSRILERIKGVKDKILSILETIKDDQSKLLVDQEGLKAQLAHLNELADRLANLPQQLTENEQHLSNQLAEQNRQLADYAKQLAEYDRHVAPVNDTYSYPQEVANYRKDNPEVMLLQYLRTFLSSSNVLEVGANVGDVTCQLLSAGYRVFAFEPQPEAFDQLCDRFEGVTTFRSYENALGASDGTANLYKLNLDARAKQLLPKEPSLYGTIVQHALPDGAKYAERVEVKLRMLRSMHDAGEIPGDVSIVKIDTEGGDLDVIRGMGNTKYAMIMTSFWDGAHFFSGGEFGLLAPIVVLMRNRGYPWHLVIYRVFHGTHSTEPRYYCNIDQSVRSSWGNALFFRDYDLFSEAQKWCAAMMPANQSFGL